MTGDFLAIDWGTTNRRVYVIDGAGVLQASEHDDRGVLGLARDSFPAEATAIRARFGDLPMICAGMVGSVNGWIEAAYCPCPAGFEELAAALTWIEPGRTAIVPGLSSISDAHADVMRGEEVQLLGAIALGLTEQDALLCQPGTHCKWARIADDRIASFQTTMTGELFGHLKVYGLLADFMTGAVGDGEAFRAGLTRSSDRKLLGDLFGARVAALTGQRGIGDTAAYVSGLLIGCDLIEQEIAAGSTVHLLADPALGNLYAAAIAAGGSRALRVDSDDAFVAGITRLWTLIQ